LLEKEINIFPPIPLKDLSFKGFAMESNTLYSQWNSAPTQRQLLKPLKKILTKVALLGSRSNKPLAKLHLRFDLNSGVSRKLFQTEDSGAERPFVCSIKEATQRDFLQEFPVKENTHFFYAMVLLKTPNVNQTKKSFPSWPAYLQNIPFWALCQNTQSPLI